MLDVGVERTCEMTGADDQERGVVNEIIRTPVRARTGARSPERWFVRRECLDQRHTFIEGPGELGVHDRSR